MISGRLLKFDKLYLKVILLTFKPDFIFIIEQMKIIKVKNKIKFINKINLSGH
jgi:hypothetical protein